MTSNTQTPSPEAPRNFGEMLKTMSDDEIVAETGLQPATVAERRTSLLTPDGEIAGDPEKESVRDYAGLLATKQEAEIDTVPRSAIKHTD